MIYLYTNLYPYSTYSEAFLRTELFVASQMGLQLTVVPVQRSTGRQDIPVGVSVDDSICDCNLLVKLKALISICFPKYIKLQWTRGERIRSLKCLYEFIKYSYASELVYYHVEKAAGKTERVLFYSYWLSYPPIAFARYKELHPETKHVFISRGHGSDVYSSELGIFYPLRRYTFSLLDAIFTISAYGKEYIGRLYDVKSKTIVSHLGVLDNYNESTRSKDVINLVSCSNVNDNKRVDFLYKSIYSYAQTHPDNRYRWMHIGGGEKYSYLSEMVLDDKKLPNFEVVLKGIVDNAEILKLYRENYFDCYLLVSQSEGIPFSIMEAYASGIPAVATNVGGVSEIVSEKTGALLPLNYNQMEFNGALDYVVNNKELRKTCYEFFSVYFNATKNYKSFLNRISNIKS